MSHFTVINRSTTSRYCRVLCYGTPCSMTNGYQRFAEGTAFEDAGGTFERNAFAHLCACTGHRAQMSHCECSLP